MFIEFWLKETLDSIMIHIRLDSLYVMEAGWS